ncbi:phosphoenolpyruvate carboxykinase [Baffinella frigidus]|nr:phosphoenolpyruvate carboxykinase [Cryptophyta sp. CCMP2293]|eukprot:CAMPEP_0180134642 /NCGR_PEP_ID=MMETSP0986-20121125/10288_1 /TAXON_ID=697907 /ORGANISM="non described non described, Strain CCMP2293" /LENGTH=591 /DNA_ID=CAMNT_0022075051 /DNA_START=86 /DNA_END=1861 /DNA_ORIENTATION=-
MTSTTEGVRRMVPDLVDFPSPDVSSPAPKNKDRGATPSFDNVADFASSFSSRTSTHTVSSMVEISLPEQFVAHKGCKRNMNYEELRGEVLSRNEGRIVDNDVINVDTGKFTGRCPKDRYVVDSGAAHDNVDWGAVNIPIQEATFDKVFALCSERLLSLETLYVFDGFVGSSLKSRRAVRVVTELAWHNHFCKNMFIEPTEEELANFVPEMTIVNSRAIFAEWEAHGLRSETCVAIDVTRGLGVVTGTDYSGEMKKGAFSMMNYLLPLQGIMSMHCSATVGKDGDTAIFFGLSGTGKTTLSADPTRQLIGDDEHGWDDDGVFNLEGGCYAKMIDLNPEKEPLIHAAIRKDALLENIVVDENDKCLYSDGSRTENTRGSYPMYHIPNHEPSGKAGHASNVIFLTCDAFGVLPPVSKLTTEQALYHLVSGYTAKVAGTEQGITEPTTTFSTCFGGAFMPLPAKVYATLFQKKIEKHGVSVYLVNTGWTGGAYGVGKRMDIVATRQIVSSILDGSINDAAFSTPDAFFQLSKPLTLNGVAPEVLDPEQAWADKDAYRATCEKLSGLFAANFLKYSCKDEFMASVADAGPGGRALL